MDDVTQRDREAAEQLWTELAHLDVSCGEERGRFISEGHKLIADAFARHRTADTARIAELEGAIEGMARIIQSIDEGELRIGDGLTQAAVIAIEALGGQS